MGAETLVFMICFDEVGFNMTPFLREFISHTVGFFFVLGVWLAEMCFCVEFFGSLGSWEKEVGSVFLGRCLLFCV